MSRVANNQIEMPAGVEVTINAQVLSVKGSNGALKLDIHSGVEVKQQDNSLLFSVRNATKLSHAMSGTTRALVNNMITGVTKGFEKKLQLQGVGYRAAVNGKVLNLTLGFSHPIKYQLPEGTTAETPTQTEIIIKGFDKQLVGQVAAEVRSFRPPEPYKGKGVRYVDEHVHRKEAKKK